MYFYLMYHAISYTRERTYIREKERGGEEKEREKENTIDSQLCKPKLKHWNFNVRFPSTEKVPSLRWNRGQCEEVRSGRGQFIKTAEGGWTIAYSLHLKPRIKSTLLQVITG